MEYGEEDARIRDPWWEAHWAKSPEQAKVLSPEGSAVSTNMHQTTTDSIYVPNSTGTAGSNVLTTTEFYNGYYYPWGQFASAQRDAFAVAKMLVETKRVDLKSAKDFIALVDDLKKVL